MNETHKYRFKVPGMHCAGCIRTVEAALQRVPGTKRVRVDYLRKEATVEGEAPSEAWLEALEAWLEALEAVGYPAQAIPEEER